MEFKSKLFKLGHSVAIYVPKSIYKDLEIGQEYRFNVYTKEEKEYTNDQKNIQNEQKSKDVYTEDKPHKRFVFDNKTGMNKWQ